MNCTETFDITSLLLKAGLEFSFNFLAAFLTSVTIVGHEEGPPLVIVAAQLQLQHVRVESHVAPLDVDGRLLLSSTCGVLGGPVHLIQSPLCDNTPRIFFFGLSLD